MKNLSNLNKIASLAVLAVYAVCALPALAAPAGVVNINDAAEEQLVLLPRIGPALAVRIVEFRSANGAFESVEELMLVRGIGERTFEGLAPYVVTEGKTTLTESVSPPKSTKTSKTTEDSQ